MTTMTASAICPAFVSGWTTCKASISTPSGYRPSTPLPCTTSATTWPATPLAAPAPFERFAANVATKSFVLALVLVGLALVVDVRSGTRAGSLLHYGAVVALALHNGAIVGHLVGRNTESLTPRPDRPSRSVDRYFYEVLPQMYPQLMAYLLYRWEVIMRETAVFGILGIATLGFYVDSAFADLRLDVALVLIAATAMLNVLVDQVSRRIRRFAQLADQETTYTQRSSVFA